MMRVRSDGPKQGTGAGQKLCRTPEACHEFGPKPKGVAPVGTELDLQWGNGIRSKPSRTGYHPIIAHLFELLPFL
jgi:hypothetical protein